MRLQSNLYLIGLMGAGKTTAGRKLARLLCCEFIDTDHALEKRTGVSINHIFEVEGEHGFRERETKLLAEIAQNRNAGAVVSTGGGIILRESNRAMMRKSGTVVYLRASPELLWSRLKGSKKGGQARPLLNAPEPKSVIEQLLHERDPLYTAEADFIVDVRAESPDRMANRICTLLQKDENG